jgi:4-hydroxy-tetrahydrodipicolinate synthase
MAQRCGAAAVMIAPSAEGVPNEQRLFEYFQRIAEGISIPVVVQDHPASTQVHLSVTLLLRLVTELPSVACIKQEAVPTAPKISALLAGMQPRRVPILTGLGALYGLSMLRRSRAGEHAAMWDIYRRYLPLMVFEQQPGVAIRKEILRLRGLLTSATVRHPGASIDAATARQLQETLARTLPGIDLTRVLQPE